MENRVNNEQPLTREEYLRLKLFEMRQEAEAAAAGSKAYRARLDAMGWKPVGTRVRHV